MTKLQTIADWQSSPFKFSGGFHHKRTRNLLGVNRGFDVYCAFGFPEREMFSKHGIPANRISEAVHLDLKGRAEHLKLRGLLPKEGVLV